MLSPLWFSDQLKNINSLFQWPERNIITMSDGTDAVFYTCSLGRDGFVVKILNANESFIATK